MSERSKHFQSRKGKMKKRETCEISCFSLLDYNKYSVLMYRKMSIQINPHPHSVRTKAVSYEPFHRCQDTHHR